MPRIKNNSIEDILKDIHITLLAMSGAKQEAIKKIVGVDSNRVSKIARHIKVEK